MKRTLLAILSAILLLVGNTDLNAQALEFDGVGEFVNCGNDSTLQITGAEITLEAYIKAAAWKSAVWEGCILNKEQAANPQDDGYMLRAGSNGTLNFNIGGFEATSVWNEVNTDEGALTLDTWHHIAGVYDGTNMIIYVDGTPLKTEPKTIQIGYGPDVDLFIGNADIYKNRGFEGVIDEVKVWKAARTADQILLSVDYELCPEDTVGLVAYYKFEDGDGQVLTDETGNNHGVLGDTSIVDDADPAWAAEGVTLSDATGCKTNNIDNLTLQNAVKVYPNPATEFVAIASAEIINTISVYNVIGQELINIKNVNTKEYTLPVTNLNKGMYYLSVNGNAASFVVK